MTPHEWRKQWFWNCTTPEIHICLSVRYVFNIFCRFTLPLKRFSFGTAFQQPSKIGIHMHNWSSIIRRYPSLQKPSDSKAAFHTSPHRTGVILREWLTSHSSWRLGLRRTEAYEATFYIKIYILGQLSDTFVQSDLQLSIHTLMAVAAMQGVVQHIGSSLGFKDKI